MQKYFRNYLALLARVGAAAIFACSPAAAAENKMAFSVDVSLSPKAAARLAALNEKIVVAAYWFGEPAPAARKHANEMGQISLGTEEIRIPGTGGRAQITGQAARADHFGWVKYGAVQVNVNVYSARQSGPNNILACDLFEDAAALARARPIPLLCKLIEEH